MTQEKKSELFTVLEFANLVGIGKTAAWQQVWRRKIGHHKVGRKVFISQKHIDEYLAANEVAPVVVSGRANKILK